MQKNNNASVILRFAFCCCIFVKKSSVCHGSTILSADFLGQLNRAHKSWPTLSIVWHPLKHHGEQTIRLRSVPYLHTETTIVHDVKRVSDKSKSFTKLILHSLLNYDTPTRRLRSHKHQPVVCSSCSHYLCLPWF